MKHLSFTCPHGSYRKGDYFRYLAEFAQQSDRSSYSDLSLAAYKFAYKHALAKLEPTHPTRLGLALNFAVYYHDVRKSPERACHLGKHAFDEAVTCLNESSSVQVMRDSMMILQLLRDDLVIWSGEMQRGKSFVDLLLRFLMQSQSSSRTLRERVEHRVPTSLQKYVAIFVISPPPPL